ncbi:hypothetical protein CRENBAI_008658 [Crenichthys baileyi]|uniref:Uncharacterized protein n=1 Tax=Crenichthys baileyi TaxID=28760 RepID=A0AAV9QTM8_9TELE
MIPRQSWRGLLCSSSSSLESWRGLLCSSSSSLESWRGLLCSSSSSLESWRGLLCSSSSSLESWRGLLCSSSSSLESWRGSSSGVASEHRAKTAWAEQQRAWETALWQAKMRVYLLQPSRQLAGKPPPRQPNRKVHRADVSCGGRRVRASVPDKSAKPGEQAENGDEGDLSPDMESPTWIHQKPTAALTALQNGAASSLPPETGK